MNVIVPDTSALLDLERVGLLETCFSLPYRFTVPDLLYRSELAISRTDFSLDESLLPLGLRIEELDGDEVRSAILYRRELPSLSLPDSFSLSLSASRKWILITGHDGVRALATGLSVVCHSVLWILHQLYDAGLHSAENLESKLRAVRDHPRYRLSQNEMITRIAL